MCGISGFYTKNNHNYNFNNILKKISEPIYKRGPDNYGLWTDNINIGLAHQRLSIIDLSPMGNQPMISNNKNLIISFNGEIYNFLELKNELIKSGMKFQTNSDTEVLLNACDLWGLKKTLDKIEGMFAFALWDNSKKELTLIRDRLGEKPLYWSIQDKNFYFGSQVSSIISNPIFKKKINYNSMSNFIYRGVFDYDESIYEDVQQIEPGSYLTIDYNFNFKLNKYWNAEDKINKLKKNQNSINYEDSKNILHGIINQSVKKTMISDVPLGCFLSGGIDSSLIASLMQNNSEKKIETFSIGFENKDLDESKFASQIAKCIGTSHNELIIDPNTIIDLIPDVPKIYDEPFADSSQLPTYILSKFTRKKVKVALSGDGGDELFAGYNRYKWNKNVQLFNKSTPLNLRKLLSNLLTKISPELYDKLSYYLIPQKYRPSMLGDKVYKLSNVINQKNNKKIYEILTSFWPEEIRLVNDVNTSLNYYEKIQNKNNNLSDLQLLQLLDLITYLPNDILTKVDRASMYNSLEVRVPLLNHNIVEFALSLKDNFKIDRNNSKKILKDILSEYIPYSQFQRPKMGFAIPLASWLRGPLREWAESYLDLNKLNNSNLNSRLILNRWNEHLSGKRNWQYSIWNILILQSWREHWKV